MLLAVTRHVRLIAAGVRAGTTPRQIAGGIALGMLVGLVPKDNLTSIVLMTLLLAARVNLGAGLASAFVFSWVGLLSDPLADAVGSFLLTISLLDPVYARLYELPVVPWTAFNNTLVAGNLAIGLILLYPLYRSARHLCRRLGPPLARWLSRYRICQILFGAELAASWKLS